MARVLFECQQNGSRSSPPTCDGPVRGAIVGRERIFLVLRVLGLGLSLALASQSDTAAVGAEKLELYDVRIERDRDGIYASMRVRGAYSAALRDMLQSGVPVSFRYTIHVSQPRAWWLDRRIMKKQIETRAKLDVLSREYRLSRSMDGLVLEARSTTDGADVMDHLSRLARVKIAGPDRLEPSIPHLVRARAKVGDEFVLYVVPAAIQTAWVLQLLPAVTH